MKKLSILLALALMISLASCTKPEPKEVENENADTQVQQEAIDLQEGDMPWIEEPRETPIIPIEQLENAGEEDVEEPVVDEPVVDEPAVDEPELPLDEHELPIATIIPEENETPAIPLN